MKIASLIILVITIAISYSVPTVYEAFIEYKLNKTSQVIMEDMLSARKQAMKTGDTISMVFDMEKNSYVLFDNDKEIKKRELKDISKSVVFYKGLYTDGISLTGNKIVFNKDGVCDVHVNAEKIEDADSIFLIHKRDEAKNILERIVRIYVNKDDCSLVLLKVQSVTAAGELIFGK